ncbi:MAG: hypothetical protein ACREIC_26765, partial [Limisphaerales bacterium]
NNPNDALTNGPSGQSGLLDYALGIDSQKATSAGGGILTTVLEGGSPLASMSFKRRKNTLGLSYVPEVSGDGHIWYSDSGHVRQVNLMPADQEFDMVTVNDLTPIGALAPRFLRLRVLRN